MKIHHMLMLTTLLAVSSSYLLQRLHPGRGKPFPQDCSKYETGSGLGVDGNQFQDFWSFYPYYLCEHKIPATKLFHFVATGNGLVLLSSMLVNGFNPSILLLGLVQGYGTAWFSHFMIEQNKPATWQYPGYSFMADHVLFTEVLQGKYSLW